MATRLEDEFDPTRIIAPNAAYPAGSLKDETTPGVSDDGTPLASRVGNDWQGFSQSVLDKAGIAANGQPDSVTNPQILQGIETLDNNRQKETTGLSDITEVSAGDDLFPLIGQGIRVAAVGLWVVPSVTNDGSPLPNPALLDAIPSGTGTSVTINGASDTVNLSQVEIFAGSVDTFSSRTFPVGAVVKTSFYSGSGEPVKGLKYSVESPAVADGIIDHNDASGNFLRLMPTNGRVATSQCGLVDSESIDVTTEINQIFNSNKDYRITVDGRHFIDVTGVIVSEPLDVEFVGNGALVFNEEDGSLVTHYLTLEGNAHGSKLFNPTIINLTTPTVRNTRPGINPRNINDWEIHSPVVINTCGAGVLCSNSRRGRVYGGRVEGTLADGWHITGASFDVRYENVNAFNTGDDNFAMVATIADGPNQNCFISGTGRASGARGASMVGNRSCKMDVQVWGANSHGGIIAQDTAFNTEDNQDCVMDIISTDCGGNGVLVGRATSNCTVRGRAKNCNRGLSIEDATVNPVDITIDFESVDSNDIGLNATNCNGLNGNFSTKGATNQAVALSNGLTRFNLKITARDSRDGGAPGAQIILNGCSNGSVDVTSSESRGVATFLNHIQIVNTDNVDVSGLNYSGPTTGDPVNIGSGNSGLTFPTKRVNGTQAQFEDISNVINTKDIYLPGKEAFDTTSNRMLYKRSNSAGSPWVDSDNVVVYTPV